ncbi:MAG: exonuclease SbcCD subunit D C-terminal domain-containing protein [Bacteroidota bacterium]
MRLLHTSDWHLGHRLYEKDRSQEQKLALSWLLDTIREHQVDVLIVSGDIFDLSNPPNYARESYYNFLAQIRETPCRHVIITGGNHDSPSMLNAPAAVFRHFNIHIIGAATPDPKDQIIALKDDNGQLEALVAAVPFLRDRDLHYSQAGEAVEAREKRLQTAIKQHYGTLATHLLPYQNQRVPIITTGHLYAHGAAAKEKKSNIYVGNRKNIKGQDFPSIFDYVALGHIHRPQRVADLDHVRYSGSMIPLDFSEMADDKLVYLIDFPEEDQAIRLQSSSSNSEQPTPKKTVVAGADITIIGGNIAITPVRVPLFRRLKQIEGTLDEVKKKLEKFLIKRAVDTKDQLETLPPWLEIRVKSDHPILQLREQLEDIMGDHPGELLVVKLERSQQAMSALAVPQPNLADLDLEEVFSQRCRGEADDLPADYATLLDSFRALRNWQQENEAV